MSVKGHGLSLWNLLRLTIHDLINLNSLRSSFSKIYDYTTWLCALRSALCALRSLVSPKFPPHVKNYSGHSGFSLISVLIVSILVSVISVLVVSMINNQHKSTRAIRHQISRMNIEYLIKQVIARSDVCSCQFSTDAAGVKKSTLIFDALANESDSNSNAFTEFSSSCASGTEIIKEGEAPFYSNDAYKDESGLIVKWIYVDDIIGIGTGNQMLGNLKIVYEDELSGKTIRPTLIPLVFQVEGGDNITYCWGEEDHSCYLTNVDDGTGTNIHGNTLVGCGGASDLAPKQRKSVSLGFGAGANFGTHSTEDATDSIFIGYGAGSKVKSGANNIFIGSNEGPTSAENQLALGTWVAGDMATDVLSVEGREIAFDEELETKIREGLVEYHKEIVDKSVGHKHGAKPHTHMVCGITTEDTYTFKNDSVRPHDICESTWGCSGSSKSKNCRDICDNSYSQTESCPSGQTCQGGACVTPPPPPAPGPGVPAPGPGSKNQGCSPSTANGTCPMPSAPCASNQVMGSIISIDSQCGSGIGSYSVECTCPSTQNCLSQNAPCGGGLPGGCCSPMTCVITPGNQHGSCI